jgi:hypothetical protein
MVSLRGAHRAEPTTLRPARMRERFSEEGSADAVLDRRRLPPVVRIREVVEVVMGTTAALRREGRSWMQLYASTVSVSGYCGTLSGLACDCKLEDRGYR